MGGNGSITPRLLSIEETAAYLGRTPSAIRNLQHKGVLPFVKLGGRVQFDRQDLDAVIEKCKATFTY